MNLTLIRPIFTSHTTSFLGTPIDSSTSVARSNDVLARFLFICMEKYYSSSTEEWTEHYDETVSAYYYYNNNTGLSQWEKPITLRNDEIQSDNIQHSLVKKKSSIKDIRHSKSSKVLPVDDKIIPIPDSNNEESSQQPQQDYLSLAKIYQIQQPYRDYHSDIKCLLCRKNSPTSVLYPCQHRCVCNPCLESEAICSLDQMTLVSNGFCNCPLCGTILKKILPADNGNDEDIYWNWVLEVKPPLPDDFMSNFRHSAAIIQKVHIDENLRSRQTRNGCCLIS